MPLQTEDYSLGVWDVSRNDKQYLATVLIVTDILPLPMNMSMLPKSPCIKKCFPTSFVAA